MILNENKLAALFSKQTRAGAVGEAAQGGAALEVCGGWVAMGGPAQARRSLPRPGPPAPAGMGPPLKGAWDPGTQAPRTPRTQTTPLPQFQGGSRCPGLPDTEMRRPQWAQTPVVSTVFLQPQEDPRTLPGLRSQ